MNQEIKKDQEQKIIVLLGPPGVGKGTQAKALVEKFDLIHLSTGDLLRREIGLGTKLGNEVASILKEGKLVADALIFSLLAPYLLSGNILLDGFPRTIFQAETLDKICSPLRVLYLYARRETILERIIHRRSCLSCKEIYNLKIQDPLVEKERCPRCSMPLVHREDDQEEVVQKRLELYEQSTASLIDFYQEKGILISVQAEDSPKAVEDEIYKQLFPLLG